MATESNQAPIDALGDRAESSKFVAEVRQAAADLGAAQEGPIDSGILDVNAEAVNRGLEGNNTLGTTPGVQEVAGQAMKPQGSEWGLDAPSAEYPKDDQPVIAETSQPLDSVGRLQQESANPQFIEEVKANVVSNTAPEEGPIDSAITDVNTEAVNQGLDGNNSLGTTEGVKDIAGQAVPPAGSNWTI